MPLVFSEQPIIVGPVIAFIMLLISALPPQLGESTQEQVVSLHSIGEALLSNGIPHFGASQKTESLGSWTLKLISQCGELLLPLPNNCCCSSFLPVEELVSTAGAGGTMLMSGGDAGGAAPGVVEFLVAPVKHCTRRVDGSMSPDRNGSVSMQL